MKRPVYAPAQHYSPTELLSAEVADLETDVRCAERDGLGAYADEQRGLLAAATERLRVARITPAQAVAALLLVKERDVLRAIAARRAESTTRDSHMCRLCRRRTDHDLDAAIKYAVRSYACAECFVSADAHAVLAMPPWVVNGIPVCAFDAFCPESVDVSNDVVARAFRHVWDARNLALDLTRLDRRSEAREDAAEMLRSGVMAGLLADDSVAAEARAAVAGRDLVAVLRGADPWAAPDDFHPTSRGAR